MHPLWWDSLSDVDHRVNNLEFNKSKCSKSNIKFSQISSYIYVLLGITAVIFITKPVF